MYDLLKLSKNALDSIDLIIDKYEYQIDTEYPKNDNELPEWFQKAGEEFLNLIYRKGEELLWVTEPNSIFPVDTIISEPILRQQFFKNSPNVNEVDAFINQYTLWACEDFAGMILKIILDVLLTE